MLIDIYGPKIKQDISWYFEQPVVMVDLQKIGALGEKDLFPVGGGGINPLHGGIFGGLNPPGLNNGNEYGEEEEQSQHESTKKY